MNDRSWSRNEKALVGFGTIAAALLIGGALWWNVANQVPNLTVPTPILPADNGYDWTVRAAEQAVEVLGDESITPSRRKNLPPLTPAMARKLVAANAPAIRTLRESFGRPYVNPPTRSFTHLYPEFARFRSLARVLAFVAEEEAKAGRPGEAARCALDAIEMGVRIPRGGTLIAHLVGIACESIGQKALYTLSDRLDARTAKAAARRLEAIEALRTTFTETLTEEKWASLAGLQEIMRTQDMAQVTRMVYSSVDAEGQNVLLSPGQTLRFLLATKRQVLTNYATYLDQEIARSRQPYSPNRPVIPVPSDPVSAALMPVFDQGDFKWVAVRNNAALLTALLALRAYPAERGGFPASLDALVAAGCLARVPQDPFAGAPLRYRRAGGRYVLYSVGPDGDDDGGRAIVPARRETKHWVEAGQEGDCVARVNTY